MSRPLTRPRTAPSTIAHTRATMSETPWSTSSFAVVTPVTIIAPPTETSIPPVMMIIVIPTPMRATGATDASSGCHERAVANAEQPVADPQGLAEVGGRDEDRRPVVGEGGDDAVDLLLGPDVHALGRLGEHEDGGPLDQLTGQ